MIVLAASPWLRKLWAACPAPIDWDGHGAGGHGLLIPLIHVRLYPEVPAPIARLLVVLTFVTICATSVLVGVLAGPWVLPHTARFHGVIIKNEQYWRAACRALLTISGALLTLTAVLAHLAYRGGLVPIGVLPR
jgi:hypothetical protein